MDPIELAEYRYRDLISDELRTRSRVDKYLKLPITKIEAWIENYVVRAVEEVYRRPLFVEHATWPLRTLIPGSQSPERVAVERVDRALVAMAGAIRRLMRKPSVARKLKEVTPSVAGGTWRGEVQIGGGQPRTPQLQGQRPWPDRYATIPYYVFQVSRVAGRPWTDLVCADDYFWPLGGMMLRTPLPEGVTEGAMIVSFQPDLFFVGDSITRSMMQRVRSWHQLLVEARSLCREAIGKTGRTFPKDLADEQTAWDSLKWNIGEVQRLCLTGTSARMRDACITMVQVYIDYHPAPEYEWLGVPWPVIVNSQGRLRQNIHSIRDLETLDRIAAALGDLKLLYRGLAPEKSKHEQAIASGGLVLIERFRQAYWQGERIDIDWNRYRKPWGLLWELAVHGKTASSVGDLDLYVERSTSSTIANRWLRLKKLLPASLANHVIPGAERATYRLDLSTSSIHCFFVED